MLGDLTQTGDRQPRLIAGKILNAPAGAGDSVYATVPDWDQTKPWGPCPWAPNGGMLPAAGADCLLAFPENGPNPWIVSWTGKQTSPAFLPLTFAAGYSNFDAGGPSGNQQGGYMLDAAGFVHARGLLQKTTAWTAGETIATLPSGFRPGSNELYLSRAVDATAGHFIASIKIAATGIITLGQAWYPAVATPAALSQLTLSNITFQQAG